MSERQNRFQQDTTLKKDWGADYEANMDIARSHISFLKEKTGLSDEDFSQQEFQAGWLISPCRYRSYIVYFVIP